MTEQEYWWNRHFDQPFGKEELGKFLYRMEREGCESFLVFIEDESEHSSLPARGDISLENFMRKVWQVLSEGNNYEFKANGITPYRLLEHIDHFEELTTGNIDVTQRNKRRSHLLDYFGGKGRPFLINLFISEEEPNLNVLRYALSPGSWHLMLFREWHGEVVGPLRLAFFSDLWDGTESLPDRLMELSGYYPIPAWLEMRLYDIFSLNHVADAQINGEGGEEVRIEEPSGGGDGGGSQREEELTAAILQDEERDRAYEQKEENIQGVQIAIPSEQLKVEAE